MTTQEKTPLSQGNEALRNGYYAQAIQHFCQALIATPDLSKIITSNIERARKKHHASRQNETQKKVAVCGWELSHSVADRVLTLAKLYQTFAEVEIIGSIFPQWGREIWEPIRNTAIAKHTFIVEDESRFLEQVIQLIAAHPYDIVHLSQPRAPNIFFGILYQLIWNARVLIDIDEWAGTQIPISMDDYLQQNGQLPALSDLCGTDWTRIAVGLITAFDGITVANTPLQVRYGGSLIHHARDEQRLHPTPDQKRNCREQFGIAQDKKVVLFFDTPTQNKCLMATAQAIATLQRPDILLVIVGHGSDPATQDKLQAINSVVFIPSQPQETVTAAVMAMADVCLLLQDPASPTAPYPVPVQLGDALAMRIPVLGTPTPALMDAFLSGAILPTQPDTLATQLAQVLDNPTTAQHLQDAGERYFQNELSFAANRPQLQQAIQTPSHAPQRPVKLAPISTLLGSLLQLHHPQSTPTHQLALTPKIAVVAHVYYPELWPEIAQRLTAISHPFDLYITTTTEQAPLVRPAITERFPQAHITVQPNLGMDLLPFLSLIPELIEQGYTAVCKLHTKKGTDDQGTPWRAAMLDVLIGDNDSFTQVAQSFTSHSALQLAGPATLYQSVRKLILGNEAKMRTLFQHLQGHPMPDVDWGFFAGSMFWVRPTLFVPMHQKMVYLRTHITPTYQADGQYIHAIACMLPAAQGGHIGLLHPTPTQCLMYPNGGRLPWGGALTRKYTQLHGGLRCIQDSFPFDRINPHFDVSHSKWWKLSTQRHANPLTFQHKCSYFMVFGGNASNHQAENENCWFDLDCHAINAKAHQMMRYTERRSSTCQRWARYFFNKNVKI